MRASLRRLVADALLRLGTPPTGRIGSNIQLSCDDLAAMIGTATESLIRTLSEFKQDGFVEVTNAGFASLSPTNCAGLIGSH